MGDNQQQSASIPGMVLELSQRFRRWLVSTESNASGAVGAILLPWRGHRVWKVGGKRPSILAPQKRQMTDAEWVAFRRDLGVVEDGG